MYASDLTDAQWLYLERLLLPVRGDRDSGGRPRKHALRRVVDAMLYVVKTGCQWRRMPIDLPPWQTVYQQFRAWRALGTWDRIGKALRERGRLAKGRKAAPTVAIIDSQTVKTALKGGGAVRTQARKSRAASATSRSIPKATYWL